MQAVTTKNGQHGIAITVSDVCPRLCASLGLGICVLAQLGVKSHVLPSLDQLHVHVRVHPREAATQATKLITIILILFCLEDKHPAQRTFSVCGMNKLYPQPDFTKQ